MLNRAAGIERSTVASPSPGYTMPEVLVAVVLTGSVVLAIVGAMFSVVRVSAQNADATKVQAVLGNAADQINSINYTNCPEATVESTYELAAKVAATSVDWASSTVEVTEYKYWDPTSGAGGGWANSCNPLSGFTPGGSLQRITIEVSSPNGRVRKSIDVVKSDIQPEVVHVAP